MYVYVVDSQFQFKAKNLIKGLGDHVIFFLNEITSYATILLFINSISTVTLSVVKKKCDKWILFLLPQFDIYVSEIYVGKRTASSLSWFGDLTFILTISHQENM